MFTAKKNELTKNPGWEPEEYQEFFTILKIKLLENQMFSLHIIFKLYIRIAIDHYQLCTTEIIKFTAVN